MAVVLASWLAALPFGTVAATVGNPQTGKSYAMKAADERGAFPRRVVFDHLAWRDRRIYEHGLKENPTPPWGGVWMTTPEFVRDVRQLVRPRRVRIVVAPKARGTADTAAQFSAVAETLYTVGGVDLIGEEAGEYSRHAAELMHTIASSGGHALMRMFLICQRFGRLHIDARSNVNAIVAFAQSTPEDLQALRARCGDEFARCVQSLRPGDAPITWRLGGAVERARPS